MVDLFFDGERVVRDRGPALARRRRARLGLHALLGARGAPRARASSRSKRRGRRSGIAAEAVRDGLREIGAGPGPVNALGIAARESSEPRCHNPAMKFLRLMPGKGEVILAEGDPELIRGRGAPDRGVPPPARLRHVGRGADHRGRHRPARGDHGAGLRRDPARGRARHLLPAGRGRLATGADRVDARVRASLALVAAGARRLTSSSGEVRALLRGAPAAGAAARGRSSASTPAPSAGPSGGRGRCCGRSSTGRSGRCTATWGSSGCSGATRDDAVPTRRLRLPDLPPQADRRLPAGLEQPAERVLRRVPGPRGARLRPEAARLGRRAGQVDDDPRRRGATDPGRQHAPARPAGRSAAGAPRPVAPGRVGARAPSRRAEPSAERERRLAPPQPRRRRRARPRRRALVPVLDRAHRRGPAQADHRRREHVDRDDAVQLPPAPAVGEGDGGHPRGRRHAARVQHDRDLRRHHDGHRGDEDLARQPRGGRRLDRAGRARAPVRRRRRAVGLRQDASPAP